VSPSKKTNKKATRAGSVTARKSAKKLPVPALRATAGQKSRARIKSPARGAARSITEVADPGIEADTIPLPGTGARLASKADNFRVNLLRILALLAVIAITVYVYNLRDRVEQFSALGYPGIFIVALIANATILIPAPGVAIVYAMGAVFHPIGVGIAAGTGGAIGELSGYLAGFSGQAVIERTDIYTRTKPWIDKYGGWAILFLSAIPNPFFDMAGIAAGIAKMPLKTFLFFVWMGQLIKMTLFAYAGRFSIDWLAQFFK
jgi:membrane protein DedA with SNARE-associated domain